MAIPNSRNTLKEYCLRNLCKPVIDIKFDEGGKQNPTQQKKRNT